MSEVAKRFGENLAPYLARSGLSQEELAMRAAVNRTQISPLLHGRQIPRLDTVVKLAGALDIPPAALLEGMIWKPATNTGEFKFSPPDSTAQKK